MDLVKANKEKENTHENGPDFLEDRPASVRATERSPDRTGNHKRRAGEDAKDEGGDDFDWTEEEEEDDVEEELKRRVFREAAERAEFGFGALAGLRLVRPFRVCVDGRLTI